MLNMLRQNGVIAGRSPGRRPNRSSSTNSWASARPRAAGWSHCAPPMGRSSPAGQLLGRVVSPYTFETLEEIPTPFQNGIMIMPHLTRNVVESGDYGFMVGEHGRRDGLTCPRARTASDESTGGQSSLPCRCAIWRSGSGRTRVVSVVADMALSVAPGETVVHRRRVRVRQVDDGIVAAAASSPTRREIARGAILIDGDGSPGDGPRQPSRTCRGERIAHDLPGAADAR